MTYRLAVITLYGLPMILALVTVDGSHRRQWPRWIGILVIVVICAVAQVIAHYLSLGFLGVVDASA